MWVEETDWLLNTVFSWLKAVAAAAQYMHTLTQDMWARDHHSHEAAHTTNLLTPNVWMIVYQGFPK